MDTSQNLAIESFSFNWVSSRKFCFDSLDEYPLRKSFEFFEDKPSEEVTKLSQNSIFHFPNTKPHSTIVHADEIFSRGLILPKYSGKTTKEVFSTSYSVPSSPNVSFLQINHSPNDRVCARFLRSWRKVSKKIVQKYFTFFKPCREVTCTRRSVKVDDFDGKYRATKSFNNSPQFSPKINYAETWSKATKGMRKIKSMSNSPHESPPRVQSYNRRDLCMDFSIDEAILHCKKSFEKS